MGAGIIVIHSKSFGRLGRGAGVALAALLLAACAQTELAIHAAKQINEKAGDSANRRVGDYKIGSPYQINGVWYYPKEDYEFSETGVASWYGQQFHGKSTANGEIFDMNELTAAHRTLQMPAVVRVTNLENGRSVLLRINDRGPFARNRVIDVSRRGAQLLGFMEKGTAMVRIDVMADESRQVAMDAQRKVQVAALQPNARARVTAEPLNGSAPVQSPSVTVLGADTSPMQLTPLPAQVASAQQAVPLPQSKPRVAASRAPASKAAAKPVPRPENRNVAAAQPAQAAVAQAAMTQAAMTPALPAGEVRPGEVRQIALRGEPRMFVQVGAFNDRSKADRLRSQLVNFGPTQVSQTQASGQRFFRVRVGPVATVEQADRVLDAVIDAGHSTARVVVD